MVVQREVKVISTLIQATLFTVVLLTFFAGISGCARKGPAFQKTVTFNILPEEKINNSKSLHLVIRTVSKKSFIVEDYDEIADLIYAEPPDKSLLTYYVVMPGQEDEIKVEVPVETNMGIYGMFMEPGEKWKVLLQHPVGEEYDIIVEGNSIKLIDKKKQSFWEKLKGTL